MRDAGATLAERRALLEAAGFSWLSPQRRAEAAAALTPGYLVFVRLFGMLRWADDPARNSQTLQERIVVEQGTGRTFCRGRRYLSCGRGRRHGLAARYDPDKRPGAALSTARWRCPRATGRPIWAALLNRQAETSSAVGPIEIVSFSTGDNAETVFSGSLAPQAFGGGVVLPQLWFGSVATRPETRHETVRHAPYGAGAGGRRGRAELPPPWLRPWRPVAPKALRPPRAWPLCRRRDGCPSPTKIVARAAQAIAVYQLIRIGRLDPDDSLVERAAHLMQAADMMERLIGRGLGSEAWLALPDGAGYLNLTSPRSDGVLCVLAADHPAEDYAAYYEAPVETRETGLIHGTFFLTGDSRLTSPNLLTLAPGSFGAMPILPILVTPAVWADE